MSEPVSAYRVLIVDDHSVVRAGLRHLLAEVFDPVDGSENIPKPTKTSSGRVVMAAQVGHFAVKPASKKNISKAIAL